jgi:hypothetical protein
MNVYQVKGGDDDGDFIELCEVAANTGERAAELASHHSTYSRHVVDRIIRQDDAGPERVIRCDHARVA